MKDKQVLLMPFAIMACSMLVFVLLQTPKSRSQPILQGGIPSAATYRQPTGSLDHFIIDSRTGETVEQHEFPSAYSSFEENKEEEEEDVLLQTMPGTDFKAYVRADIATFYGKEPGSLIEQTPIFNGQAGKFINMSPQKVSLWWDGPNGPVLNSEIKPWGAGGTACFPTHKFIFTYPNQPNQVLCRFTVQTGTAVYYCNPYLETSGMDDNSDPGRGIVTELWTSRINASSLDRLWSQDRASYDAHLYNLDFGARYKNFTGGSEWLAMYPPSAPRHKIWRADHFGQVS